MWGGRHVLPSKNFNANNSLLGVRNLKRHTELRKPWNDAFKPSSLPDYEEMLLIRAEQFVDKLKELARPGKTGGTNIDLASWISRFSFVFL